MIPFGERFGGTIPCDALEQVLPAAKNKVDQLKPVKICMNCQHPWKIRRAAILTGLRILLPGLIASSAYGQSAPQVNTQKANAIRTSSAVLNGMVVPGSSLADVWFEWGTSTNYGNTIGLTNFQVSRIAKAVRVGLEGLSPNYVYHYRLAARNSAGTIYGANQQFTLGGSVLVWGNTSFDQGNVPADLTNAVAIGGGGYHCAALRNDGTISAWGGNAYGQATVPTDLTNAVALSVGQVNNLALLSDGTVRAWGAGTTLGFTFPGRAINYPGRSI